VSFPWRRMPAPGVGGGLSVPVGTSARGPAHPAARQARPRC